MGGRGDDPPSERKKSRHTDISLIRSGGGNSRRNLCGREWRGENLLLPTEGDRKDVCGKIYFRLYVVQIWELGSSETQDFLRPPSVIPFAIPNFIYGKWGSTRKIPWCPFLRSLVGQEIYETGSSSSSSSPSPKEKRWRDFNLARRHFPLSFLYIRGFPPGGDGSGLYFYSSRSEMGRRSGEYYAADSCSGWAISICSSKKIPPNTDS